MKGDKFHVGHANQAWQCLDLLEVLCQLAERGHAGAVRPILEYPRKHCPEILLLGVASISVLLLNLTSFHNVFRLCCIYNCLIFLFVFQTTYNLLQYEVYSTLFPELLKKSAGASVFIHLWHVNNSLLLRGFIDAFSIDPDNMIKALDLCHELKVYKHICNVCFCCLYYSRTTGRFATT